MYIPPAPPKRWTKPPKPKDNSLEGIKDQLYKEMLENLSYIADKAGFDIGEFVIRLSHANVDNLKKVLSENI